MNFYSFDVSPAFVDQRQSCKVLPSARLPGVECNACGETWAAMGEVVMADLPARHYLHRMEPWPVSPDRLTSIKWEVRAAAGLPEAVPLLPGTRIGLLRLELKAAELPDFQSPAALLVLMSDSARNYLQQENLTGWIANPVTVEKSPKRAAPAAAPCEFVVNGIGGSPVTDPPVSIASTCLTCGRVKFDLDYRILDPQSLQVDEKQWDGSDFFRLNPPFHGLIWATARARMALERLDQTTYRMVPMEQRIEQLVQNERLLRRE